MEALPNCLKCKSSYTYEDGELYICPECGHEWNKNASEATQEEQFTICDANGTPLVEGDFVTVIKDLKVKGASSDIKIGTKFKIGRLLNKPDHNIDCKIQGFGAMHITAAFVKKA